MIGEPFIILNNDKLDFNCLSENTNFIAIKILENNIDKIDWNLLSKNENAIHILEKNLDKVNWHYLSRNKNAIKILENNLDKINWHCLSLNPNAIHLLEKNLDKVDWCYLSQNPNAINLLENNLDKVNWYYLMENPNAIHILENNIDKIDWSYIAANPNAVNLIENNLTKLGKDHNIIILNLCRNPNPKALELIESTVDLTKDYVGLLPRSLWYELLANPSAIKLCKKYYNSIKLYDKHRIVQNPNCIDIILDNPEFNLNIISSISWNHLSANSRAIILFIKYDYEKMKENMQEFNEQLVAYVFNPNRLTRFGKKYGFEIWDIDDIY